MSLDPTLLFLSIVSSTIGFAGFLYGKKQVRAPHMLAGVVLMIFPYFVENPWAMGGIGAGIIGVWFAAVRLGL